MKKFVLFWLKEPYSDDDVKKRKKLINIDDICLFTESGTPFVPTITLETRHVSFFAFNKIEHENEVYDCRDLSNVLDALKSIEKKMEKNKQ